MALVVDELELLRARAERMRQPARIVVAEVGEVLTNDLGRSGALLDDLAGDPAEPVVAPVRFDERHRPGRGRAAVGDQAGDVPGLHGDAQRSACHRAASAIDFGRPRLS